MHVEPESYPCRLYLISAPQFDLDVFERELRAALAAGDVGCFQLRLKDTPDAEIYAAARRLIPVCREHDVAFIMNDRADIALEVGADGVHLGQDDLLQTPIASVRKQMGEEMVIGVSCHDSTHMAMQAGEDGADYVAFGAFFPTNSKSPEKLARYGTPDNELLDWWYHYTVLPCVAIGGMTPQNCGPIVAAGADFIAAIQSIWQYPAGAAQAVADFNAAIKQGSKQRRALDAA